jgi:hypothetical protein
MASDERQPLLRNRTEERAQIRAHEVTSSAQEHPDYPIDHGSVAWMQVVGGFIIFANSWYVTPKSLCFGKLISAGAYPTHLASSKRIMSVH